MAEHFIKKYSQVNEKKECFLTDKAKEVLGNYSWPGNVRELENVIERAVLICSDSKVGTEHLFLENISAGAIKNAQDEKENPIKTGVEQNEKASTLYEMEKNMIFDTLNKANWNKTKASKILGISVRTMRNKLHEYGIDDLSTEDK